MTGLEALPKIGSSIARAVVELLETGSLAKKAGQHNPDRRFVRTLFARGATDVFDNILAGALPCSGFLSHLHSLAVTMSQKTKAQGHDQL